MTKYTNKRNTQVNNFKIVLKITQGVGPRAGPGLLFSPANLVFYCTTMPGSQKQRNTEQNAEQGDRKFGKRKLAQCP